MAKIKKKKSEKREKILQAKKIGVEAKYNYSLIGLVLGISILYVISTLFYSGGYFFLPVDDSFSYFHYAKQLSAGHPFQYNFGDTPTTGVRSLLYTIILAPGFFIGLTGNGMICYAFLLGMIFFFLSGWLILRIAEGFFGRELGIIAGLLFLLNGPISWGYLSGTEIGLFSTVILATLYFFLREQDGDYKKTVILGSLLAMTHPEGAVLSILLVVVLIINLLLNQGAAKLKSILIFIPAIIGISCVFLNLILIGSLFSTFLQSKSPLFSPNMPLLEILAKSIKFYAYLLKEIFGGFNGAYTEMISPDAGQTATYFAPFAFLFFLFGSLPLAVKEIYARRLGINLLMVIWFFMGIGLVAITFPTDYSWNMTLIPYYPLFLLGVVVGIYHFSLMITNMVTTISLKQTFYGLSSFFIVFSLFSTSFFVVAYGKICKDNYHQKMGLVKWIRENIPADVTIAMNGINTLRYYENRNFIDLCGVGTKGLAKAYQNGVGSIFEWLEEKKLYPACFVLDRLDLTRSGLLKTELYSARVVGVRPIEPINVYQADWSLSNKGDEPMTSLSGYKLVDKIDVANLDSEAEHKYRFWEAEPGLNSTTYVYTFPCLDRQIMDGGRSLSGGEDMVVKTQPGQEMKIVMRTTGALKLDVLINGKYCRKWIDETNPGNTWSESLVTIPGQWVTSNSTKVHIEVRDKQQDTYSVGYYWFFQK
ncbi:MAG: hypothetical protein QME42_00030 [bacterium]|nr:hypothetical protein [bacterium]